MMRILTIGLLLIAGIIPVLNPGRSMTQGQRPAPAARPAVNLPFDPLGLNSKSAAAPDTCAAAGDVPLYLRYA